MKSVFIKSACLFLLVTFYQKVQGQVHANLDGTTSFTNLWENATIKNINYQLSLKKSSQDTNFYKKILLSGKEFIRVQSQKGGLRKAFIDEIFKPNEACSNVLHDAYIVENYRSTEGFSASISIFFFGDRNKISIYELSSGKWKLIKDEKMVNDNIKSIFTVAKEYLCDTYYLDESIIITKFEKKKVVSKAFFFPCSIDFKKLKESITIN